MRDLKWSGVVCTVTNTHITTHTHSLTSIIMCVCTALARNSVTSKQRSYSLLQRTFPEHAFTCVRLSECVHEVLVFREPWVPTRFTMLLTYIVGKECFQLYFITLYVCQKFSAESKRALLSFSSFSLPFLDALNKNLTGGCSSSGACSMHFKNRWKPLTWAVDEGRRIDSKRRNPRLPFQSCRWL